MADNRIAKEGYDALIVLAMNVELKFVDEYIDRIELEYNDTPRYFAQAQEAQNIYFAGDYLNYLRYIEQHERTSPALRSKIGDEMLEGMVGHTIFNHVQSFIVNGNLDSLKVYGDLLVKAFPQYFQGYFLLGVYNKSINNFGESTKYFNKAMELVPFSHVLDDKPASIERVKEIMSEMGQ